jgi:uncharacterized membrane protein YfcA
MIDIFTAKALFLMAAAFFAGLIDSMAGGGGLISVPALFSASPNTPPATLLGTNKLSAAGGTLVATYRYLRVVKLPKKEMFMAAAFALVGSFAGAACVTLISGDFVRSLLPWTLLFLLVFTLLKKDMGVVHEPKLMGLKAKLFLTLGVGAIGFYDGFFGPGTGSFLMFLFVQFLGFDFLHAATATKVLNSVTNLAALALFIPTGHVDWGIALMMLLFSVLGGRLGSGLALSKGSQLVRKVFIGVVLALILKTANDAYKLF